MNAVLLVTDNINITRLLRRFLSKNKIKLNRLAYRDISLYTGEMEQYISILIDTSNLSVDMTKQIIYISQNCGIPIILFDGEYHNIKKALSFINHLKTSLSEPNSTKNISKIAISKHVTFDLNKHQIINKNKYITLSSIEFKLLKVLCEKTSIYLSTEQLLDLVWGEDKFVNTDTVYVYIRRLRQKIEKNPDRPKILINQKGGGYRISSKLTYN
jgi:two-component system, OmpR family, response regulator VicR